MSERRAERRLAAILAVDVADYSRLMGKDEAGTLSALNALRTELIDPKIAEHKGRIFKATGDGLMAEFPSVVNAVACAADIQRANAFAPEPIPADFKTANSRTPMVGLLRSQRTLQSSIIALKSLR